MHYKPIIGITVGDTNGIGPEIIIKTFSDPRMMDLCTPVIFASSKLMNFYKNTIAECTFQQHGTKDLNQLNHKHANLFQCWDEDINIQPGVLSDIGGKYAIRSLQVATQCLKDGQIEAIITAPIHKGNTVLPDFNYTGHTPFFKDKFGAKDVLMLLFTDELRVGLVTEHVPVTKVAQYITKEALQSKINLMKDSLIKDFGIQKPKIAVLGLNPHAGDEGKIGDEEQTIITPVIETFQQQGHLVYGPFSADAFFARQSYKSFDGVLAMYHDQGLVPFKTIAQGEGVNYTAGMSVVRTSPDHGTAFDIAGKDLANPDSFREAVFQAISILNNRKEYATYTANPLKRSNAERERNPGR